MKKKLFYLSIYLSGFSVLVIEILGTRILAPIYGTTIYVWSGLITVTLFSLSIGYLVGGWLADKKYVNHYYLIFILAGLSILFTIEIRSFSLLTSEKLGVLYGPLLASFMLFALPLFILGMVDPFAIKEYSRKIKHIGSHSGQVLGIATIGGLTGALTSAYLFLPYLGLTDIFLGVSLMLIVVGASGYTTENFEVIHSLYRSRFATVRKTILFSIIVVISLFLGGNVASDWAVRSNADSFQNAVTLDSTQNIYSLNRVLAIPNEDGVRCFAADSALQTCIDPNKRDEVGYTAKMGYFIEDLQKDSRMMLLGLGGGKVIKEWGRSDVHTDIVDINPATFDAAETFFGVDFNSSYSLHRQDARRFLRNTDKKYDLILIDVATTFSPPSHLYSREYFELLADRLTDKGVAVVLLQEETPYDDRSFQSMILTAQTEFSQFYGSQDGVPYLLVMSNFDSEKMIANINKRIMGTQDKLKTRDNFSTFTTLPANLTSADPILITDNHNPVEYLWQDKIPLFKKFSVLLREDF